jgi:hypothetical protein
MRSTGRFSVKVLVAGCTIAMCGGLLSPVAANASVVLAGRIASQAVAQSKHLSEKRAEKIFLAIFFMQGPETLRLYDGDPISRIEGFDAAYRAANSPHAKKFSAKIVADLKRSDPSYFQEFGVAVSSGNPFTIEDLIDFARADITATRTVQLLHCDGRGAPPAPPPRVQHLGVDLRLLVHPPQAVRAVAPMRNTMKEPVLEVS